MYEFMLFWNNNYCHTAEMCITGYPNKRTTTNSWHGNYKLWLAVSTKLMNKYSGSLTPSFASLITELNETTTERLS